MMSADRDLGSNQSEGSDRSLAIKVAVILLAALAIMFAPVPVDLKLAKTAATAMVGKGIAVTGNSVISHVSKCDANPVPLAAMIGPSAGRRSFDISYPGQSMPEGLNFGRIALSNRRAEAVVVFVSLAQIISGGQPDLRTQSFFRLAGGNLAVNDLGPRLRALDPIAAKLPHQLDGFEYHGVRYPPYNKLKTQYLLPERLAQGCPETIGVNRAFIEALYWNNYLNGPLIASYVDDLHKLSQSAARSGKPVMFVLLPIDFEDIRTLNPELMRNIAARRDELLRLARGRIEFHDLTEAVPAQGFADRWCGCGHLQESGRKIVADRVAQMLAAR